MKRLAALALCPVMPCGARDFSGARDFTRARYQYPFAPPTGAPALLDRSNDGCRRYFGGDL